ncbi:hypothetical protein AJ80_05105 [Polytolypa hystricis UAMH7299]|uniref:Major facilitator superfamily (MFS) profile domain-containing protein n=1 Tax=Polytolypa hystricis (strain UAMH7299) TaxID=1447883 RepID=A0A2B7Y6E7_POLH7|nr:hypothetical protein AJ80_05105 [Polytolypa hystricis UAMH7299]
MTAPDIDTKGGGVTVIDEKSPSPVTDSPPSSVTAIVEQTPKRTWRSHIWDTFDKPREERRFLFKFDAIVMTFASLGFFIKILDQFNINSAFVSGMKEDLQLNGNELNYMTSMYTAGYIIGEIPRSGLPFGSRLARQVTWSVLTILLIKCTNANQLYALRFFIGLAESSFYPGIQYLLGSWYRKDELAKRACIFHASGNIAAMFSGYLMAATYNLEGVHGYHGWQWLFIINTVISLPIAFLGYFFLPDVPEITKAWYLTGDDIALARKRMELEGRANRQPYTVAKLKKIFSSWRIWLLTLVYVLFSNGNGYGGQPAFALWLKTLGYGIFEINTYPTIQYGITVAFTLIFGWTSDGLFKGGRWQPIIFAGIANIIFNVSLAVWDINVGWKWACYCLGLLGVGLSGIAFAWAHEICTEDNEERALVVAFMSTFAQVVQTWLPLIIWQTVDAPRYRKGFISSIFIAVLMMACAMVIRHLHKQQDAKKQKNAATV